MSRTILFICILFFIGCTSSTQKNTKSDNKETVKEPVKVGVQIGNKAPDLNYPNPEGENISLYSLRGKIVLIDFWASWCPPCRRESPNLVAIYKDFKDKKFSKGKGFTIYSVSCDRTKEEWTEAIKKDHLIWKNHVSDLKGWEAEATYTYFINSIPSNVLIDGDGIILAKDLRDDALRTFLGTLLIK